MLANQDQALSTNDTNKYIFKDTDVTSDNCRRETSETTPHTAGACRALAQGDYTHRHHQVATIVQNVGCQRGPPMLYYKYGPQSVLENSYYELYKTGHDSWWNFHDNSQLQLGLTKPWKKHI